jgi:hypothetical protein
MSKKEKAIGGLIIGAGIMLILSLIANDPRISPLWRYIAKTAEGDIYQHVVSGDLITVLA